VTSALAALRPRPALAPDAHKGDAGRVFCACGSTTMPGAAILVARAAQRAGAGLVTLACLDPELLQVVPPAAPEAVYAPARAGELPPSGAVEARLAGPGLGATPRTRRLVLALLAEETAAPLALDADALNVFAGEPERLADCRAPLVLTPHPGEAQRLLGRPVPRDEEGRRASARELARRARAVVCLKGRGTVVTDPPGERVFVNPTGNPALATAGSGDVLAGALVACLASTVRDAFDVFDAACWAVALHGLAGDLGARELGVRGLVASDLERFLPAAERELAAAAGRPG
jgi:NAD(P)H-hydrate epimerase